jgi:hypothetical protein
MASRSNPVQSTPLLPPPKISLSDKLLSSSFILPHNTSISYSIFAPSSNPSINAHESIETARRSILLRNSSAVLLDSLLTSVHIGTSSFFYIFLISPQSQLATSRLNLLQLEGLTGEYFRSRVTLTLNIGLLQRLKHHRLCHKTYILALPVVLPFANPVQFVWILHRPSPPLFLFYPGNPLG